MAPGVGILAGARNESVMMKHPKTLSSICRQPVEKNSVVYRKHLDFCSDLCYNDSDLIGGRLQWIETITSALPKLQ